LALLDASDASVEPYVVHRTEEFVCLHDGYPKAKMHMLALPRHPRLDGITDLRHEHIPMLRRLAEYVAWLIKGLEETWPELGRGWSHGVHAVPSLRQLHVHILSPDLDSTRLNAKHWNAFQPPFLVTLDDIVETLELRRSLEDRFGLSQAKVQMRNQPFQCHRCKEFFGLDFPKFKKHQEACFAPLPVVDPPTCWRTLHANGDSDDQVHIALEYANRIAAMTNATSVAELQSGSDSEKLLHLGACDGKAVSCEGILKKDRRRERAKVCMDGDDVVHFYGDEVQKVEVMEAASKSKACTRQRWQNQRKTNARNKYSVNDAPNASRPNKERRQREQDQHEKTCGELAECDDVLLNATKFDMSGLKDFDFSMLGIGNSKRILVLGMGGGCDVFAAYALGKHISSLHPESTVMYANTKGAGTKGLDRFHKITDCLFRPPADFVPIAGDKHGTCDLELGCPRGPEGSPLVFTLQARRGGRDLSQLIAANADAVLLALQALQVDLVVGVDCGGDSISGGVDWQGNVEAGRDRQMLHCLRISGIPFLHVVFGVGCDGETEESRMLSCCARLSAEGSLHGAFSVEPFLSDMISCCRKLNPTRTPNLMWRAHTGDLASVKPPHGRTGDYVCIPRGRRNTCIPRKWMTMCLAITYDSAAVGDKHDLRKSR
jgi:diadenosine tetraphosphate (Ap4A) HIT family hydrolase